MPITAMLELELKPESVPATRRHAPSASRHPAFDGNLGTDVLVDQDGEAHWINYQRWETVEHEEAYRKLLGRRRSNHRPAFDARRAAGQNELQHYRRDAVVSTARSPGPPTATPPFVEG